MFGWRAAFANSMAGLRHAWRHERAARQEMIALGAGLVVAPLLARSGLHFVLLLTAVAFVLVIELLNAGLEAICDRVTKEHDPYVKVAKDCGSAAVMVAVGMGCLIWAEALWSRLA